MILRQPAVSGYFYPKDAEELSSMLGGFLRGKDEQKDVLGCVVPHAGYAYCGKTQSTVYKALGRGDATFIILGPNHYGEGSRMSIMTSGRWKTPLGDYQINRDLAIEIREAAGLEEDISAHSREHSIEVQLPWLQKLFPHSTFVPISLGRLSHNEIETIGNAISKVSVGRRTVVIASSDFTHYGPAYNYVPLTGGPKEILEYMEGFDGQAAQFVASLDPEGFMEFLETHSATVCGYIPIATMLYAVKEWASKGTILDYSTSYPISKSTDAIVGYSSIIIE